MVRPRKVGLDYFPMDVDMDQDDKIYLVKADYGWEGFAVVVKLLMEIYKESYYIEWDERKAKIFSRKNLFNLDTVNDVINLCLEEELFSNNLFEQYGILTSNGIQKRYFEATTRRKSVEVYREFLLVEQKDTTNNNLVLVNVDINSSSSDENVGNSTQSIVKDSKAKKSKEKEEENNPPTTNDDAIVFYQNNIGIMKPYMTEEILDWINDLGDVMVIEAMKRSLERNKPSWGYTKSILKSWYEKGIRTAEQAHAEEVEFKNQQQSKIKPFYPKQQSGEVVPDWFKDRDNQSSNQPNQHESDEMTEEQKRVAELLNQYSNSN